MEENVEFRLPTTTLRLDETVEITTEIDIIDNEILDLGSDDVDDDDTLETATTSSDEPGVTSRIEKEESQSVTTTSSSE